ncbi:MAG: hypothetical protein R2792_01875 [Saprospiraceae bacterium]|jgi:hypothetical protein
MRRPAFVLPVLFLVFTLTACAGYKKVLQYEQSMLQMVARSDRAPEEKMDSLFASAVRVMDAALQPINPVKGGKIVDQYYRQNQASMEQIAQEMQTEFKSLNLIQQGTLTLNMAKSPSAKQFAKLYPKFKKKYKQVKTASRFLTFFGKNLGALGKLIRLID